MAKILIDTTKIVDWASFHQLFKDALGFPDFYGRNIDAWIDCLSHLHEEVGLCNIKLINEEILQLHLTEIKDFNQRQPKILNEFIECTTFVNDRFIAAGQNPKLSIIFLDTK